MHAAHVTVLDQRAELPERGAVAEDEPELGRDPGGRGAGHEIGGFRHRSRQWLLAQDGEAGVERRRGHFVVHVVGRHDRQRVEAEIEQRPVIADRAGDAEAGGERPGPLDVRVGDAGNRDVGQVGERGEMRALGPEAGAHDADPDGHVPFDSPSPVQSVSVLQ